MKNTMLLVFLLTVCNLTLSLPSQAQETVLYSFTGQADGSNPLGDLVLDAQGNLYGTTSGTVFELTPSGTETIVYAFTGGKDGGGAYAGLIEDAQGNFYGTTTGGGANGAGTVFEVTPAGKETVLHSFNPHPPASMSLRPWVRDGTEAFGGLVRDAEGNLYGTTADGGNYDKGIVFKVTPEGKEVVLYSFFGYEDGAVPAAALVMDAQGNLYGTTNQGGGCQNSPWGCGTVFKVSPSGEETVLYRFTSGYGGGPDGGFPWGGLVQDANGNLYGATQAGGGYGGGGNGCGTVFKVTPSGVETILYRFACGTDGFWPTSDLIMDAQGNLYGTTSEGGLPGCQNSGCGTVFEVTQAGTETILYRFTGGEDGAMPAAGLVRDAQGNFYGTTEYGGLPNCSFGTSVGCGVVFKLTP